MKVKELIKILEKDGNKPECEGVIVNTGTLIKGGLLLWLERQVLIYRQALWRASSNRLV